MGTEDSTRDRVLRTAMRLFGEHGYAGTTIAQIEEAAGLSPGSGSLYRHFRSKQELLQEGVRVQLQGAEDLRTMLDDRRGLDGLELRDRLNSVFRLVIARLERARDLVWMLLRDYRAFPELMARLRDEEMLRVGEALARWLSAQPELKDPDRDWAAVSAVLVASLSHYWLLRDAFDIHPFDLDEDRYLRAVAELTIGSLHASAPPSTKDSP